MSLSDTVSQLRKQRENLQTQIHALDIAIGALGKINSNYAYSTGPVSVTNHKLGGSEKRAFSAAVRAKLSQKAKARWARFRAAKAKAHKGKKAA